MHSDEQKKTLADLGANSKDDNIEAPQFKAEKKPVKKSKQKVEGISGLSPDAITILTTDYEDSASAEIFFSESLLDDTEKTFYLERRRKYLAEFQINKSSDMGVIHRVIMEEIICERLYKLMLENPERDYSDKISDSHKRYDMALRQLGASRDQRIKNREQGGMSIADVAKSYFERRREESLAEDARHRAEDELLLSQQDHRFELELGTVVEKRGEISTDEDEE